MVETFGLTILEGMAYGLPALIPPVGGITELVEHGRSGYWTNSRNLSHVSENCRASLNRSVSTKWLKLLPASLPAIRKAHSSKNLAMAQTRLGQVFQKMEILSKTVK